MIQPPLKLWEHQTRIVSLTEEILREQTSLLVAAPTGSGKCHPAGTMILMYDGNLKAVESIVPGDQLMAPDSQPRKVRSTSTGYGPIVEIWPVKGKPWRCNDEHVLTLVRTGENDRPKNRSRNRDGEIVNISVKEYRGMSRYYKHIHKLFRSGEIQFHHPKDRRESLIPPYILGLLLGDGDLTNGRAGVTTVDAPVVKALKEYAKQIQVRLVNFEDPDRTPSYYFRRAHTAISNPSLNHCRTLGIIEHRAGDKFIPDRYKTALPEDRLELLAGLMDTDGHLHQDTSTGYDYLSKSKRLAEDVCFVARSLGLAAHLRIKTQAEGIYWRVSISGETNRIPCRIPRKQAKPRLQKKNHLRTGFTIRDLGHKKYYGFTLDGDGRYLLDDFTVTHNTVCLSEISRVELKRDRKIGLLVHRQELVSQSEEKIIRQTGIKPGVVWQGRREWEQPITIMAQDTISGLEIPPWLKLYLLMVDEAHHAVAPGWIRTVERLNPEKLLGFTATPFRQDREPLSPHPFAMVIRPVTPMELIERKLLCPAVIESPVIHDRNGEPQPINQAFNPEEIYLQAVKYALAQGRTRILLYASQTRTSSPVQVIRKTVDLLQAAGINTGGIFQNLSTKRRRATLARFQDSASASVLVNYMALTEGTDLPHVDCIVIGRHTASESTIIQMIGRGLRTHEEKEDCLVLEYTERPDMNEIIHYWRLDSPEPEQEKAKRERVKSNTAVELENMVTQFPRQISQMDQTRVQYPWFRPFGDRPLMALPLWSKEGEAGRYITVEPLRRGGWRVSTIILLNRGPAPVMREQSTLDKADDAAIRVRMALGQMAPMLRRQAPWRQKPASTSQLRTLRQLNLDKTQDPDEITAGEVWDSISRERFRRRVKQAAL